MANSDYESDCITIRILYRPELWEQHTAIFIKREGRDPTEKEFEATKQRLVPDFREVYTVVGPQLEDADHNSDYTYHVESHPDFPRDQHIMRNIGTSRSNPFDLSGRSSVLADYSAPKRQKRYLKEAQSVSARTSSQHPGLLNSADASKQVERRKQHVKETSEKTKTPSQPIMHTQAEPVFADLMAGFDSKMPVQTRSGPSPSGKSKLPSAPSFVRDDLNDELTNDKHKHHMETRSLTQPLSVHLSAIDEQLSSEVEQVAVSPVSSQQPAPDPGTAGIPDATNISEHPPTSTYSAQISEQIDSLISEAVGANVSDQVRNIFKSAMLNMSLWIFQHPLTITTTPLIHSLDSQININEKNSRAANKSLEAALDSYSLKDINLTPKAIEHYQLLDKQEKERQEFLEDMAKILRAPKRMGINIVREVKGMRDEMVVKRDQKDDGEEVEKGIVKEVDDKDEDVLSKKRKRDVVAEEEADKMLE